MIKQYLNLISYLWIFQVIIIETMLYCFFIFFPIYLIYIPYTLSPGPYVDMGLNVIFIVITFNTLWTILFKLRNTQNLKKKNIFLFFKKSTFPYYYNSYDHIIIQKYWYNFTPFQTPIFNSLHKLEYSLYLLNIYAPRIYWKLQHSSLPQSNFIVYNLINIIYSFILQNILKIIKIDTVPVQKNYIPNVTSFFTTNNINQQNRFIRFMNFFIYYTSNSNWINFFLHLFKYTGILPLKMNYISFFRQYHFTSNIYNKKYRYNYGHSLYTTKYNLNWVLNLLYSDNSYNAEFIDYYGNIFYRINSFEYVPKNKKNEISSFRPNNFFSKKLLFKTFIDINSNKRSSFLLPTNFKNKFLKLYILKQTQSYLDLSPMDLNSLVHIYNYNKTILKNSYGKKHKNKGVNLRYDIFSYFPIKLYNRWITYLSILNDEIYLYTYLHYVLFINGPSYISSFYRPRWYPKWVLQVFMDNSPYVKFYIWILVYKVPEAILFIITSIWTSFNKFIYDSFRFSNSATPWITINSSRDGFPDPNLVAWIALTQGVHIIISYSYFWIKQKRYRNYYISNKMYHHICYFWTIFRAIKSINFKIISYKNQYWIQTIRPFMKNRIGVFNNMFSFLIKWFNQIYFNTTNTNIFKKEIMLNSFSFFSLKWYSLYQIPFLQTFFYFKFHFVFLYKVIVHVAYLMIYTVFETTTLYKSLSRFYDKTFGNYKFTWEAIIDNVRKNFHLRRGFTLKEALLAIIKNFWNDCRGVAWSPHWGAVMTNTVIYYVVVPDVTWYLWKYLLWDLPTYLISKQIFPFFFGNSGYIASIIKHKITRILWWATRLSFFFWTTSWFYYPIRVFWPYVIRPFLYYSELVLWNVSFYIAQTAYVFICTVTKHLLIPGLLFSIAWMIELISPILLSLSQFIWDVAVSTPYIFISYIKFYNEYLSNSIIYLPKQLVHIFFNYIYLLVWKKYILNIFSLSKNHLLNYILYTFEIYCNIHFFNLFFFTIPSFFINNIFVPSFKIFIFLNKQILKTNFYYLKFQIRLYIMNFYIYKYFIKRSFLILWKSFNSFLIINSNIPRYLIFKFFLLWKLPKVVWKLNFYFFKFTWAFLETLTSYHLFLSYIIPMILLNSIRLILISSIQFVFTLPQAWWFFFFVRNLFYLRLISSKKTWYIYFWTFSKFMSIVKFFLIPDDPWGIFIWTIWQPFYFWKSFFFYMFKVFYTINYIIHNPLKSMSFFYQVVTKDALFYILLWPRTHFLFILCRFTMKLIHNLGNPSLYRLAFYYNFLLKYILSWKNRHYNLFIDVLPFSFKNWQTYKISYTSFYSFLNIIDHFISYNKKQIILFFFYQQIVKLLFNNIPLYLKQNISFTNNYSNWNNNFLFNNIEQNYFSDAILQKDTLPINRSISLNNLDPSRNFKDFRHWNYKQNNIDNKMQFENNYKNHYYGIESSYMNHIGSNSNSIDYLEKLQENIVVVYEPSYSEVMFLDNRLLFSFCIVNVAFNAFTSLFNFILSKSKMKYHPIQKQKKRIHADNRMEDEYWSFNKQKYNSFIDNTLPLNASFEGNEIAAYLERRQLVQVFFYLKELNNLAWQVTDINRKLINKKRSLYGQELISSDEENIIIKPINFRLKARLNKSQDFWIWNNQNFQYPYAGIDELKTDDIFLFSETSHERDYNIEQMFGGFTSNITDDFIYERNLYPKEENDHKLNITKSWTTILIAFLFKYFDSSESIIHMFSNIPWYGSSSLVFLFFYIFYYRMALSSLFFNKVKLSEHKEIYKNTNLLIHNIDKNKKNYYFNNFHYFEYESLTEYRMNSILLYNRHRNGLYLFNKAEHTEKLNSSILNIALLIWTTFFFKNMNLSINWVFHSVKYKSYNLFNIISYQFVMDATSKEEASKKYYLFQSYSYNTHRPHFLKKAQNFSLQSQSDININYEYYNKFFNFYFFFYNFSKDYFLTTNYIDNYNYISKKLYTSEYNFLTTSNVNSYTSILNSIIIQLRKEPYFELKTKKSKFISVPEYYKKYDITYFIIYSTGKELTSFKLRKKYMLRTKVYNDHSYMYYMDFLYYPNTTSTSNDAVDGTFNHDPQKEKNSFRYLTIYWDHYDFKESNYLISDSNTQFGNLYIFWTYTLTNWATYERFTHSY